MVSSVVTREAGGDVLDYEMKTSMFLRALVEDSSISSSKEMHCV